MELTEEQKAIIESEGNVVVIAVPGSGKTTTISYKIGKILTDISEYNGIIAISYTNKASDELKDRVLRITPTIYNSFFGTIYNFYLSEIIVPFARYIFSMYREIEIVSYNQTENEDFKDLTDEEKIQIIKDYYLDGKIILEGIPLFANYIFDCSQSCRKYLKSRYTHIFVDEYQDCEILQHNIFKKIVEIGIVGVAVGDPDQSIFKYSGSNPSYLLELSEMDSFNSFGLSINHRSHKSIVNYAYKFLFPNNDYEIVDEKRIYKWNINGDEKILANNIDALIPKLKNKFEIDCNGKIAILCRSNSTAKTIFNYIETPAVCFFDSPLDKSSKDYEIMFKNLLVYILGSQKIYPENIIDNLFIRINKKQYNHYIKNIIDLKKQYKDSQIIPIENMKQIIKSLFGETIDMSKIDETMNDENYLQSYYPADEDKILIMTIHKSKGLEFDATFLVDLHKYIIPTIDFQSGEYNDLNEDKCIHYVALTRAKKVVLLTINSLRHNSRGELKRGEESEFISNITRPDLILYRK